MSDIKQRYILKHSLHLFRLYGLKVVTMDEIARAAGISKKTIYQYFNDKDAVINHLYSRIITIIEQQLNKIKNSDRGPVHQYIKMIELAMIARDYITSNTVEDLKRFHAGTFKKLQNFIDKGFIPAVTGCIEKGREEGLYQSAFNSNLMAMICLSELDFLKEINNKKLAALSPGEIKQQVTRHLLYGITTNAGKKQADKYFSTINNTR